MSTPPFTLSDAELLDVWKFAEKNDLHVIRRLVEELQSLRSAYRTEALRNKYENETARSIIGPSAGEKFYQYELDLITGETHGKTVA